MPTYEAEVEIETHDLTQSIQDRWRFEAVDADEAREKADEEFAKRQTVHPEGTLRITGEDGKSYERPFPVGGQHAEWT